MNRTAKIIKPKLGLLELAKQLGNVQQACKAMDAVELVKEKQLENLFCSSNTHFVKMKTDE